MKHRLAVLCGFLLIVLPVVAESQSTDKAQIVSSAEIIKIDAKKKSLQVRELASATSPSDRGTDRQSGRRSGGGGGGGRRGGGGSTGGVRLPGGVGFPGGGGGQSRTNQAKEYKVFVKKDTVLTLAETNIDFNDLHIGDRITFSGTPKGHDVEATAISRDLH